MEFNPIENLHFSINDIFAQYDDGEINYTEAVEILGRVCRHFLKEGGEPCGQ
jgi:hypothetical protein